MNLSLLQHTQHRGNFHAGRYAYRTLDYALYISPAVVHQRVKILFMNYAHNRVDGLGINGHTRKSELDKLIVNTFHLGVFFNRDDVNAGNHDILYVKILEFNGGSDKLRLVLLKFALVFSGLHYRKKLSLGNRRCFFDFK